MRLNPTYLKIGIGIEIILIVACLTLKFHYESQMDEIDHQIAHESWERARAHYIDHFFK